MPEFAIDLEVVCDDVLGVQWGLLAQTVVLGQEPRAESRESLTQLWDSGAGRRLRGYKHLAYKCEDLSLNPHEPT